MKRLRNLQFVLCLLFLGIIVSVPLLQLAIEKGRGERPQAFELFQQKPTARNLRAYERNLEDASWVAAQLRPCAQYAQFAWLKDGGAKALVGQDGWLFYKPGVHYLTERPGLDKTATTPAEAVPAILDFRNQLAARGIRLLVMPAPNKESIYPEKLTRRASHLPGVLSSETRELLNRLKAANVEVVDLFDLFAQVKATAPASATPLYLAQDSHWSPAGVELAARAVARHILEKGWSKPGIVSYEARPAPVARLGDVLRMLQVPRLERETVPETAPCQQIIRRDTGRPYQDQADAEILVLGDSFLRIYQSDEPGAAGFSAHLARDLSQPVTSIINDGSINVRNGLGGTGGLVRFDGPVSGTGTIQGEISPEPGTVVLMLGGMAGLLLARSRRP